MLHGPSLVRIGQWKLLRNLTRSEFDQTATAVSSTACFAHFFHVEHIVLPLYHFRLLIANPTVDHYLVMSPRQACPLSTGVRLY